MICALNEDSDQPGHPSSLTRVFVSATWARFRHADSDDSDQIEQIRLIRVFTGCTGHFVGFAMQ